MGMDDRKSKRVGDEEKANLFPHRPPSIPELADLILTRLAIEPTSAEIIIGGGIALKHYVDFRMTHDIDGWWRHLRLEEAVSGIKTAMAELAAARHLILKHRTFGQTDSFELHEPSGKQIFAFQISKRDVPLDDPIPSEWPPIMLETFRDNVGSKMNALVQRGAPRDFVDIFEVVKRGLTTTDECWRLWEAKNTGASVNEAKIDILTHLKRIEQRRPISSIPHEEREHAQQLRSWFQSDFTKGIDLDRELNRPHDQGIDL